MALIPDLKRLSMEDLPGAPGWVQRLIAPLNMFMEQTYTCLNKNLTLTQNVSGKFVELVILTPTDYATGGFPVVQFPWEFSKAVQAVTVVHVVNVASTTAKLLLAPFPTWTQTGGGSVRVSYISGLAASTKYSIRLQVM